METESGLEFLSRVKSSSLNDLGKDFFCGPLNPPELIEVLGVAGCGKSLFCLDLMATTLLPKTLFNILLGGLEAGVMFIDCDQHFNVFHFADIMERKIKRQCHKIRAEWKGLGEKKHELLMTIKKKDFNLKIENTIKECLKNLIYLNCTDSNQFTVTLMSVEQYVANKSNLSLIVVDSLSSFYWYDRIYRLDNWCKMETYLNKIFHSFISIINKYHLVCVCTKQSLFKKRREKDEDEWSNVLANNSKSEETVAYEFLGKEWSNGVTIKVLVTQKPLNSQLAFRDAHVESHYVIETIRRDKIKTIPCTIHEDGIRLIKEVL